MYDIKIKNDLLFWNMDMIEARKVTIKKVQVDATRGERNLWIPQGRMCQKELYKILM